MKKTTRLFMSLLAMALLLSFQISFGSAHAQKKNKKQQESITISAAGDCTFGSDRCSPTSVNFYSVYNRVQNPAYFFKNVREYFEKDDLTIVNFEGTLTKRTTRADKTFAFRGAPRYIRILKEAHIEAVAFANNHCRDFGSGSYTDTIDVFKAKQIIYSSYSKVGIYKTDGRKIGMISVNGLEGVSKARSEISSGIKKLKEKDVDLIIVSMHAGIEKTSVVDDTQVAIAHYAIDKGANLVLGHHPHVLQRIARYKGKYIVYSLGNFCFGGNTNPSDKDTMIFQQTFTFKGKKLRKNTTARIIPCSVSSPTSINNYQPTPLKGSAKKRVISRLNRYSKNYHVHITRKGYIKNPC